jgi:alpha-L-fucosidase
MMQPWFLEAKLGIFIHWGIYAVDGTLESWGFYNEELSYEKYMDQLDRFSASRWDPDAWADLIERAGARYAVLTSKHHDGVALWDTQLSDLNVVKKTPAGRDLIRPFCDALRKRGLKVGLYFSHLDWSHPDYAPIPVGQRTARTNQTDAYEAWVDGPQNPAWQRFLQFQRGQLQELCQNYSPDLLWFDGDWVPEVDEYWCMDELRVLLHEWRPGVVLNSRMRGHGDYKTPEQGLPITRPDAAWEFCVTINDSWGYRGHDQNHKSPRQLVHMFCECIGMGGNMLLDVGPMEDGTITPEQTERLEALGDWIRKHAEAVYPTEAGLPPGHFYGPSTLTKDRETLYVFLFDRPWDESAVKGIRNPIKRVSVVDSGTEITQRKLGGAPWLNIPGILWITVPETELDSYATVLKIELEGQLDLYTGAGQADPKDPIP